MVRLRTTLGLAGLLVFAAALVAQAAPPPAENILPDSTKGFVTVPNIDKMVDQFNKTPVGRLLLDPSVQPFRKDLERQLEDREAELENTLGFQLKDLRGVVTGELALAVVRTAEGRAALLMTGDVSGNAPGAQQLVQKIQANMARRNATAAQQRLGGTTLFTYNVPATEKHAASACALFLSDGLLVVGEDLATVAGLHNRIATGSRDNVANVPSYRAIVERCATALPNLESHLAWFVEPIGLAEAVRASYPNQKREGQDLLKLFKGQGFQALQGIGGNMTFAIGPYGLLHRTNIYAPPPYVKSMQMLKFPNGNEFTPPAWVPAGVGTYTSFYLDIQNAFTHFGHMFDAMFGEGEEGVWLDVLDSLEHDPDGPQINLGRDLIAHLGHRAVVFSDNTKPIGPFSQRRIIGIEAKNEAQVSQAMDKVFKNDPQVKPHIVEANGRAYTVYEIIPEEEAVPVDGEDPLLDKKADAPNSAVVVANGHLYIASHIALLQEVIANPQVARPLAADVDFQTIIAEGRKLGLPQLSVQGFARNSVKFEVTYEMFRANRLPETDTPIARLCNAALQKDPNEARKPRLDGSKLPPWETVRHLIGIGGTILASEPNGWFAIGYTLDTGGPRAASARRP